MRRLASIVLLLPLLLLNSGVVWIEAASSSGQHFTDDFERAASTNLGSNWTEIDGDFAIDASGRLVTNASGTQAVAFWNTNTSTTDQFCKTQLADPDGGNQQGSCAFRYDTTNYYRIWIDVSGSGNTSRVQRRGAATENCFGGTQTYSDGDHILEVFKGTGTNRVLKVYNGGATDPDSGFGSFAFSNWSGATQSVCFHFGNSSLCSGWTTVDCSADITVDPLGKTVGAFGQATVTDDAGFAAWEAGDCSYGGC